MCKCMQCLPWRTGKKLKWIYTIVYDVYRWHTIHNTSNAIGLHNEKAKHIKAMRTIIAKCETEVNLLFSFLIFNETLACTMYTVHCLHRCQSWLPKLIKCDIWMTAKRKMTMCLTIFLLFLLLLLLLNFECTINNVAVNDQIHD